MEQVIINVELHETILKCSREVMFIVADPEEKTCHGIITVRKVVDIDDERMDMVRKLRKRRAPDASVSVINERKGRRFECGYCEYESRAQYITARHVARVHQKNIKPTKCDLCPFKTIYSSNMKRHIVRVHSSVVNVRLRCESKSSRSSMSLRSKSGSTSTKSTANSSSSSSVVPLN